MMLSVKSTAETTGNERLELNTTNFWTLSNYLDQLNIKNLVSLQVKHGISSKLSGVAWCISPPITTIYDSLVTGQNLLKQLILLATPKVLNGRKEILLLEPMKAS